MSQGRPSTRQLMLLGLAQAVLFIVGALLGRWLGLAFGLAMQKGYAIGGRPFARYPSMGAGLITMDVGCVLAAAAPGEGVVEAGVLQGGAAAVAMHAGGVQEADEERHNADRRERLAVEHPEPLHVGAALLDQRDRRAEHAEQERRVAHYPAGLDAGE